MEKINFYNKEGEKLTGILHNSKKKTDKGIILVHGFKGNKDRDLMKNLDKELSKEYNIFRFDFSGNGESEGKFEEQSYSKYVEELKIVIDYLKKHNQNIIIIGHSLGGNITILEEEKYKNIDKLILLAPAVFDNSDILKRISLKQIIALIKGSIILKVFDKQINQLKELKLKRKFFMNILLYNVKKAIKKIKKPILVILAEKDKAIPLKKSINFYEKNSIKYEVIKDSGHNFREEKHLNELTKDILKWL
ncbi:MAG: lysophospholipase [Nanoarchaeota archaeon]|nr:lysophospholipase [Nanoarchaeota archaeon]